MNFIASIVGNIFIKTINKVINNLFRYIEERQKRIDYIKYGAAESRKKGLENVIKKAERTKNILSNVSDNPFDRLRSNRNRIKF